MKSQFTWMARSLPLVTSGRAVLLNGKYEHHDHNIDIQIHIYLHIHLYVYMALYLQSGAMLGVPLYIEVTVYRGAIDRGTHI